MFNYIRKMIIFRSLLLTGKVNKFNIMSCFIVPLVQAMATSAYRKHLGNVGSKSDGVESEGYVKSIWKSELHTLEKMLWGGTLVLVVDHIASGELTLAYPFMTVLGKIGGLEQVFSEMLTAGIPMSLAVTAVWALVVLRKSHAFKRQRSR